MTTALVVDDIRQTADSICQMLAFFNIEAVPVYGGLAALLSIRDKPPDIIFMDISMPGFDGFEVIGFIQREPKLAKVPVVVVTLDDQPETRERAMQSGAVDVLIKPVSIDALEGVLKKAKLP